MNTNRLEAFSDGVFAIIITIMVLELKVPHGSSWEFLIPLIPVFLSYVLSFVYVGIYWNNHHHLFQASHKLSGPVLWANLHLLFWLSLIPFTTGWMGENHFETIPVALYGFDLLMAAVAYNILVRTLLAKHETDSVLVRAMTGDRKGNISLVLYVCAIPLSFLNNWIAVALFLVVAVMWLVPDRRIEKLF